MNQRLNLSWTCLLLILVCACSNKPEVSVVHPRKDEIKESFREPGKTQLDNEYMITMPVNGRISRINLDPGDTVKKGELLVKMDMLPFEEELNEAKAVVAELEARIAVKEDNSLENTTHEETQKAIEALWQTLLAADAEIDAERARAERATKELSRVQQLAAEKTVPQSELDDAMLDAETSLIELRKQEFTRSALNSIYAAYQLGPRFINEWISLKKLEREPLVQQLIQAKARLAIAEYNYNLAQITAPIDGVVLERMSDGDTTLPSGQPLLRMGNLKELEVIVDVLTQDALKIKIGTPVLLEIATLPNPLKGSVKRIDPAGFTKLSSLGVEQQRVNVIVAIDEIPEILGVGYRVQARFLTGNKDDALIVPRFSVLQDAAGNYYVFKVLNDKLMRQDVKLGLRSDLYLEVENGLSIDDWIIETPDTTMKEGESVRIVKRKN